MFSPKNNSTLKINWSQRSSLRIHWNFWRVHVCRIWGKWPKWGGKLSSLLIPRPSHVCSLQYEIHTELCEELGTKVCVCCVDNMPISTFLSRHKERAYSFSLFSPPLQKTVLRLTKRPEKIIKFYDITWHHKTTIATEDKITPILI